MQRASRRTVAGLAVVAVLAAGVAGTSAVILRARGDGPPPSAGVRLNEDPAQVLRAARADYQAHVAPAYARVDAARAALTGVALSGPPSRVAPRVRRYTQACRAARVHVVRLMVPLTLRQPAAQAANGLERGAAVGEQALVRLSDGPLSSAAADQLRAIAAAEGRRGAALSKALGLD